MLNEYLEKYHMGKRVFRMQEKLTMLIVDDVEINRAILAQFFKKDYLIIEAENGREALGIMESQPVNIVLLDIIMPVMDGFELLNRLKRDSNYADIPVVVMTARNESDSEVRAMEIGAADYIKKPYNPTVVRCRVRNVMARIENEWRKIEAKKKERQIMELHHYIELDSLTGIYNREAFYRRTAALLQQRTKTAYEILYFDISCFKVINAFFHVDTGNLLLKTAANFFRSISEGKGLCGRLEADHFVLCMPEEAVDIKKLIRELDRAVGALHIGHTILFYAGVYPVEHVFLPVDRMCDRAHMAMNTVKGQYVRRYAYYDEKMRRKLYEEQEILREMDFALAERQFCVYFQPIYSLQQHCAISAEALVRWIHPEKGLISPGRYIPLFERNGFVVQIDHFVWESVCQFLQDQKEKGGQLIPVSVNVSRLNFFDDHLFAYITGLLEKYHLDPELLKLEITESAYMDRPYQLLKIMRKFRSYGFKIMMDDFGSGYSSLNMLKDVEVDILKVDMKFVQDIERSKRAAAVVRGIVQLAENLQMDTVMEGVETQSQLDALQAMGCNLIQGYYFSRPLPKEEFIRLLDKQAR